MTSLPITALFTALLGTLYLALIIQVIRHRRAKRVAYEDGGDKRLRGAIRAQVNAGEQIPLFLIALGVCELGLQAGVWLLLVALVFSIGRVLHGYAMTVGSLPFRTYGTAMTLTGLILILATALICVF